MDRKRQVIKDLQNDRDAVVRMLLLSIQIPPQKMWFDKLTQTGNSVTLRRDEARATKLSLSSCAISKSSPYIEKGSINLVHSKQFAVKEMKLREFQLSYHFCSLFRSSKKVEDVGAMKNI